MSLESGWLCISVPVTCIVLAVIFIIAGLIDLPTYMPYSTAERVYSNWQPGFHAATLKGTAIWTLGEICLFAQLIPGLNKTHSLEERDQLAP